MNAIVRDMDTKNERPSSSTGNDFASTTSWSESSLDDQESPGKKSTRKKEKERIIIAIGKYKLYYADGDEVDQKTARSVLKGRITEFQYQVPKARESPEQSPGVLKFTTVKTQHAGFDSFKVTYPKIRLDYYPVPAGPRSSAMAHRMRDGEERMDGLVAEKYIVTDKIPIFTLFAWLNKLSKQEEKDFQSEEEWLSFMLKAIADAGFPYTRDSLCGIRPRIPSQTNLTETPKPEPEPETWKQDQQLQGADGVANTGQSGQGRERQNLLSRTRLDSSGITGVPEKPCPPPGNAVNPGTQGKTEVTERAPALEAFGRHRIRREASVDNEESSASTNQPEASGSPGKQDAVSKTTNDAEKGGSEESPEKEKKKGPGETGIRLGGYRDQKNLQ